MASSDAAELPQLPACQMCHHRKVKCDSNRPKCKPCTRSGTECIVLDPLNNEQYTRQYIHELEQKERALNAEAAADMGNPNLARDHPTSVSFAGTDHTARSTERQSGYMEGSGLSFMRSLFTDVEWRKNNASLLQNFATRSEVAETTVTPNSLPPSRDALLLVNAYLEGSHVQNPFMLRSDIHSLHDRVYVGEPLSEHTSHDLFRIFMIFAIGSVNLYRKGVHQHHPFGYYLSAMQRWDKRFLGNGYKAIQDLLLIGRFGIYHHIGTSVWDIGQLCMRMCIEQGLHEAPYRKIDILQEQLQRRLFWNCYMLDHYSSMTLDRPFAIDGRDIKVDFPANANDEEVIAARSTVPDLTTFCQIHTAVGTNEMSVFFCCVQLRQISGRIHSKFSQPSGTDSTMSTETVLATGKIHTKLNELLHDLEIWRQSAPVFENPSCLYQRQEWFDLLFWRERLILIRKALDQVPKRNGLPPQDLLTLCLESARRVIMIYSDLFQSQRITYTRSYFQMLFAAGLSVIFCLSTTNGHGEATTNELLRALAACEELLQTMVLQLPDVRHYAIVFEALHHNISQKIRSSSNGAANPGHSYSATQSGSHSSATQRLTSTGTRSQHHPVARQEPNWLTGDARESVTASGIGQGPAVSVYQPGLDNSNIFQMGPDWSFPNQDNSSSMNNVTQADDALKWAFLNNATLWHMEAGLGEYAYGDPTANSNLFGGFDFNI